MRRLLLVLLFLFSLVLLSSCESHQDITRAPSLSVVEITSAATATQTPTLRPAAGFFSSGSSTNSNSSENSNSSKQQYVLNTNTKKFHYPSCSSVKQMKDKNKKYVDWPRQKIIDEGYDPCGRCRP